MRVFAFFTAESFPPLIGRMAYPFGGFLHRPQTLRCITFTARAIRVMLYMPGVFALGVRCKALVRSPLEVSEPALSIWAE